MMMSFPHHTHDQSVQWKQVVLPDQLREPLHSLGGGGGEGSREERVTNEAHTQIPTNVYCAVAVFSSAVGSGKDNTT